VRQRFKYSSLFRDGLCAALMATLLTSMTVAAADTSTSLKEQAQIESDAPADKQASPKVDAFAGKGLVDNTGVPDPGKFEINLSMSRAFGPGRPTDLTALAEINYGFEFYKDMQIGCAIPYVSETGKNDDGSSYRDRGGGSTACTVKVLFYNNDSTGWSASAAVSYQRAKSIMFNNFPGNPLENHVIVPVVIQKDINDGKISLVGTVSMDHTISAGQPIEHQNQITYGIGAGYRINDDSSISVDATKTIQGVAWVDVTYMRRSKLLSSATGRDTLVYVTVGKSSNGSYADSNQRVVQVGIQINGKHQHGPKGGIFHEIVKAQENAAAVDAANEKAAQK